ncbi:MAG: RDD family protein [Armatimonadota bacterium]
MRRDVITIRTPEQIEIEYELAGLGSRFVACLLDTLIVTVGMAVLVLAAWLLFTFFAGTSLLRLIPAVIIGISGLLAYVLYYIICEMQMEGQSPGKRATGLRVIRDDGRPISLADSVIRNLVRIADFLPGSYFVGIISVWFSRYSRRLGDYAAGTIVVKERTTAAPQPPPAGVHSELSALDRSLLPKISMLTDEDIRAARRFMDRREGLDPQTRGRLAQRISQALSSRIDVSTSRWPGPEQFIESVVAAVDASSRP